jgi:glycosyltransferase involved in cell wall biosynthesis
MNPILVITYWSFKDALVQTYTLPYVKIIARVSNRKIYMVCLEQVQVATSKQERIEINTRLKNDNIEVVFFDYYRFGIKQIFNLCSSMMKLFFLTIKQKIEFIHIWGMPAGAIGYLLSTLTGKKLILDSYEPHAEAMVENGTWQKSSFAFKILFYLEKKQSQKAVYYIAAASGMKEYAQRKYNVNIIESEFFVKPACTDLQQFTIREKDKRLLNDLNLNGKLVCVYAGKLGGIYLDDEVFDFFKQCYLHWGDRFNVLMLTNASADSINQQLCRVSLPKERIIYKFVWHQDIPKYLSLADFAFTPVKPVPTKRYCTPIKDGEYWAMGLPVVITANISDDSDLIEKYNAGYVLKALTCVEYTNAIKKIDSLLAEDAGTLKQRIASIANQYRNFNVAEEIYREIYNKPDNF